MAIKASISLYELRSRKLKRAEIPFEIVQDLVQIGSLGGRRSSCEPAQRTGARGSTGVEWSRSFGVEEVVLVNLRLFEIGQLVITGLLDTYEVLVQILLF